MPYTNIFGCCFARTDAQTQFIPLLFHGQWACEGLLMKGLISPPQQHIHTLADPWPPCSRFICIDNTCTKYRENCKARIANLKHSSSCALDPFPIWLIIADRLGDLSVAEKALNSKYNLFWRMWQNVLAGSSTLDNYHLISNHPICQQGDWEHNPYPELGRHS